jgi:hypothetical protein
MEGAVKGVPYDPGNEILAKRPWSDQADSLRDPSARQVPLRF